MIYYKIPIKLVIYTSLRFHGDKINKVFSGRQPRQANYKIHRFGEQVHLHNQGDMIYITLMMQKQEKQQVAATSRSSVTNDSLKSFHSLDYGDRQTDRQTIVTEQLDK